MSLCLLPAASLPVPLPALLYQVVSIGDMIDDAKETFNPKERDFEMKETNPPRPGNHSTGDLSQIDEFGMTDD